MSTAINNFPCTPLQEVANEDMQLSGVIQTLPTSLEPQTWPDYTGSDTWNGSPSDWSWQILNDFSGFPNMTYFMPSDSYVVDPHLGTAQQNNRLPNEQVDQDVASSSEDEAETDIVPGLAARLGSLRVATDGRLRYYGTASNHHFLSNSNFRPQLPDAEEMKSNASIALQNAQLDQEVTPALQTRFIQLFFTWHNPCHNVIDRNMFNKALAEEPRQPD